MKGQWLGSYSGDADGKVMINIDEVGDHYEGVAYLNPSTNDIPASVAYLSTLNKDEQQTTTAHIFPIDPRTGFQSNWEEIKVLYGQEIVHSSTASVDLKVQNSKLHVNAVSNINVIFSAILDKPSENGESKISGQKMSWKEFKSYISSISKFSNLYRG